MGNLEGKQNRIQFHLRDRPARPDLAAGVNIVLLLSSTQAVTAGLAPVGERGPLPHDHTIEGKSITDCLVKADLFVVENLPGYTL